MRLFIYFFDGRHTKCGSPSSHSYSSLCKVTQKPPLSDLRSIKQHCSSVRFLSWPCIFLESLKNNKTNRNNFIKKESLRQLLPFSNMEMVESKTYIINSFPQCSNLLSRNRSNLQRDNEV